jgi:transitional endoplasmic reticulum ATPase
MKVSVGFPLGSDGPLGRAAAAAARHPSYRIEGTNSAVRVSVELDLPDDWRLLDDFSGLLRGEGRAEYAANGAALSGEELFGGLRCFLR